MFTNLNTLYIVAGHRQASLLSSMYLYSLILVQLSFMNKQTSHLVTFALVSLHTDDDQKLKKSLQGKTSSTEDDLNRWWPQWRRPQWKITYIEDELIGRWIQWKMTLTEDDFNGSMVWLIFADWNFEALPDGQMDGLSSKNAEAYCTLVFVSLFGEHCNLWAGFINYIFTEATWAQYNMI